MASETAEGTAIDEFLAELRQLRERAGHPSLRSMARTVFYSHTALGGVVGGRRLPSLPLTLAFVRACDGDEVEWRRRWQAIHNSQRNLANGHPRTVMESTTAPSPTQGVLLRILDADPLVPGDDIHFVADVTIPDGTIVRTSQELHKTWRVRNSGQVEWRGRYLTRQGLLAGPGLCTSVRQVPVPDTMPGQEVEITVTLIAPDLPGSSVVYWKMTDEDGRYYFPGLPGLYMTVNISDGPDTGEDTGPAHGHWPGRLH